MSGIKYREDQIKELLNNKYVKDCTPKYITFTDEFKVKVLELDTQ
jgi:Fe-S-cluster formation regulator IscX/YfhJ